MNAIFRWSSLFLVATLFALSEGYNGCPDIDPMDHTVHLPHPTDCNLFYRCDHGYPKLDRCPASLHFNPNLQVCDWPDQAGCTAGRSKCIPLVNTDNGVWGPDSCVQGYSEVNDRCKLQCKGDYELSGGSDVRCTEEGWVGMNGLNQIPQCKAIEDLGGAFIDRINKTLHGKPANMLFLLDESGSVAPNEFAMEVTFIKALVAAFPLASSERTAGVITFDSYADVDIRMNTSDTCSFMDQADLIRYNGGGTDILRSLNLAITEIAANSVHNFTLVFLITDGASSTNPQVPADIIKSDGNALFTVGIANYNPAQLIPLSSVDEDGAPIFFGIDSFAIFEKVAEYLETAYNNGDLDCSGVNP